MTPASPSSLAVSAQPLDVNEARALTERIKEAAEQVWALLLEAHERRAWETLGYDSWRDYASTEFGMAQSRAYQLLDQARVVRALEEATGSTSVELTEAAARDRVVSRARLHAFIEGGGSPVASAASATAPPQFPPECGEAGVADGADEPSSGALAPPRPRPKPRTTARVASSGSTSRKRAGAQTPALPRSAAF